jgi:signal transduction histidine kinase
VRFDRGRVLQVLDNLVSNAVKFTPKGGTVHVSLAGEADRVVLEVTDSGIGIAEKDQRHLFERFFRAENAIERQVPGTGLGLYISRVIAEAHGGTLSVRSELGRGSTFRFELPLAVVAVAEPAYGLDRNGVGRVRVELAP